mmetsp:Transcript_33474/g.60303  ORF Transcript_33474/g.60303 Transcript_33474/m.60303 type:complete len:938 (+) Transcript_33474:84-2897(+)
MAAPSTTHSNPTLEAGSWQLLTPPVEEGDNIEVGVVEVHPSLNRIAYSTRSRTDQSQDLGKTKIVIHDFDHNHSNENIVSSFTLRELNKRINEFRTKSHVSMVAATAAHTHSQEILHSLSTTPSSTMPYAVQMLGAVQRISFLSRDAIKCVVPPGYVRDEPSRMQRLLIGFRRCVLVVSVFHLKQQKKESYARGVQVMAYIGPDDLDEYEHNEKARKRQPSSYPVPISENILAYGCYDGGIRFYDIVRRKQAKSALGPNGRGNPIVRVINANRTQSSSVSHLNVKRSRTAGCQTILPRIISVCATGIAYLWELDLSIDLDNGEVLYFDIPPPLAMFNGFVAAVSGKGIPVKYPPTLSPTSIATLSPCSSWEQTDEVNAQFEVSFDPHRNWLCWVFSPDCLGSSLLPHATREERLNMNGALVCWELTNLPRPEWPPPLLPPRCVVQLPRTADGKVSSEMVLPGIYGMLSNSHLATIYVTSSSQLMAAVTYLEKQGDSVQLETNKMALVDLKTLNYGKSYTIAMSRLRPSLIAIGTQYGILFTKISESNNGRKQLFPIQEEPTHQNDKQSITRSMSDCSSDKAVISTRQQQIYATKIKQLESRNKELGCQLDDLRHEASTMFMDKDRDELQSRVKGLLEQHAKFCEMSETELDAAVSKVETLENDLRLRNESCQALEAQVRILEADLDQMSEKLEKEEQTNKEAALELAAIEGKDKGVTATNCMMRAVQEECDDIRQQLDELKSLEERGRSERESRLTRGDYLLDTDTSGTLRKELFTAKETEESLRNYIALLEEDKATMDKELEDARQEAEKYADKYDKLTANLRADVKEQKSAIDSLVDLLERQRKDHEKETADQTVERTLLKKQISELQLKYQTDLDDVDMNKPNEETIAKLKAENAVMKADASMDNAIFLAMKVELQNALNELAEYHHEHKSRTS